MNFFKSVFSDDTTPPDSPKSPPPAAENPDPTAASSAAAWSFGGLIKTLATKSETVIENYRRDLEELGSGLRKETAVIRQVASRAVKDLPASLEAGASVAQESLETVGAAIDDIGATVWKSTALIISHGKDSILTTHHDQNQNINNKQKRQNFDIKLYSYSRFESQLRAIQCDLNTYCTVPEDNDDFEKWVLEGFLFDDKKEEIERLISENEVIKEIYNEVVPVKVEGEVFWRRYFYRVHKLKQAEAARVLLVKRATEEEEDLSWDFDDDDEEEKGECSGNVEIGKSDDTIGKGEEKVAVVVVGGKAENGESCKDSDVSVVSSQSLPEEEDLGWDEIEAIGSDGESKGGVVGSTASASSTSRVDLRKRLSSADEEEDLSWDIEDEEDKHVKP